MSIASQTLPELELEMAGTRKTLSRLPDDLKDWRPHPKSMTMMGLATHITNMLGWGLMTLRTEAFDIDPQAGDQNQAASSTEELLQKFDASLAEFRAELAGASDEALMTPWTLTVSGAVVFTMPRIAVLKGMIFNHIIHHRGQLTVYFRINDVPVPALYGPSADEN